MKLTPLKIVIIASTAAALIIPLLIFNLKDPVLIVSEESFITLYGKDRIRSQSFNSSLTLFRPVKTVVISASAADDVIPLAVAEMSSRPYCVLFPSRYTPSARIYKEKNPNIPVVLLRGRRPGDVTASASAGDDSSGLLYCFTDINIDFRRAALAASVLDEGKNGRIMIFYESGYRSQVREAFTQVQEEESITLNTSFYTNWSSFSETPDLSCVILAGIGHEFLEKKAGIPVISFSWLDPLLQPKDVAVIINDSPWVQAVEASRMAAAGEGGLIRSEFNVINNENFDRKTLRKIQNSW
ncbi:MAG: hypothetical protein FWB83_04965 [Treponema sp.]|nr:hypothetical protein [Treponema sp.]